MYKKLHALRDFQISKLILKTIKNQVSAQIIKQLTFLESCYETSSFKKVKQMSKTIKKALNIFENKFSVFNIRRWKVT